jgi:cell division protease FtsH
MNKKSLRSFIFLLVGLLAIAVLLVFTAPAEKIEQVPLSTVIENATSGRVEKIEVNGDKLTVTPKDPNAPKQVTYKDSPQDSLSDYGIDYKKVTVETKSQEQSGGRMFDIILTLLPIILIIAFFYFMMRQAQGSSNQAMSFGKSRARLFGNDKQKVTFADVAGADEAKQELTEIVEFLKYPQKFEALGAKIPKGVLLFGPPGTGKTLLARAVAGEAGVPFFSISGSEFVEMFVGVGASRVRDLFNKAKKNSPCIIFIDEIDAVGRQRGTGMGGGHDEREQTLNQILVEMDGFEQGTNVIVMAATNRPDVLDPALLRPGRFDRRVILDGPDLQNRKQILEVHAKGKPLEKEVDLLEIAKKTPGFSGADLSNLVNEAAILAARNGQKKITQRDLSLSVEKVLLGPERKSHIMSVKEKEITAYHEAGHAIVSHVLPNCNPVHKVTIVSRGGAGGVTWSLPEEDKYLHSVADFKDDLAMMLGGRMAELIVFGEITTGASNDLQKATHLSRRMVMDYGMGKSAKLKHTVFGSQGDSVFLGRDLAEVRSYSEEVAKMIDEEVSSLIDEAAERAGEVITKHRKEVDKIAKKLIADETIEGPEFEKLVGKRPHTERTSEVDEPETPAGKAAEEEESQGGLSGKPATA